MPSFISQPKMPAAPPTLLSAQAARKQRERSVLLPVKSFPGHPIPAASPHICDTVFSWEGWLCSCFCHVRKENDSQKAAEQPLPQRTRVPSPTSEAVVGWERLVARTGCTPSLTWFVLLMTSQLIQGKLGAIVQISAPKAQLEILTVLPAGRQHTFISPSSPD